MSGVEPAATFSSTRALWLDGHELQLCHFSTRVRVVLCRGGLLASSGMQTRVDAAINIICAHECLHMLTRYYVRWAISVCIDCVVIVPIESGWRNEVIYS